MAAVSRTRGIGSLGAESERQRRSVPKPRVAAQRQPWEYGYYVAINSNGVAPSGWVRGGRNPVGVRWDHAQLTQGRRSCPRLRSASARHVAPTLGPKFSKLLLWLLSWSDPTDAQLWVRGQCSMLGCVVGPLRHPFRAFSLPKGCANASLTTVNLAITSPPGTTPPISVRPEFLRLT